jgi:hypothetical protein
MSDDLSLGRLLGRREAFNLIAARCSAAEAAHLREIRATKNYLECADWEEFCSKHLHMSKENANRIIRLLDDFGPQYFEVAQLTRISPQTYRAIAPAIQDGALHANGETIALVPENADRVAAAIADIRKSATKPAPEPVPVPAPAPPPRRVDPIEAAIVRGDALAEELSALSSRYQDRERLSTAIGLLRLRLERIQRTL